MAALLQAISDAWHFLIPLLANVASLFIVWWILAPKGLKSAWEWLRSKSSKARAPAMPETVNAHLVGKVLPVTILAFMLFTLYAFHSVIIAVGTLIPAPTPQLCVDRLMVSNTDNETLLRVWATHPEVTSASRLGVLVGTLATREIQRNPVMAGSSRHWENRYGITTALSTLLRAHFVAAIFATLVLLVSFGRYGRLETLLRSMIVLVLIALAYAFLYTQSVLALDMRAAANARIVAVHVDLMEPAQLFADTVAWRRRQEEIDTFRANLPRQPRSFRLLVTGDTKLRCDTGQDEIPPATETRGP